MLLPGSATLGRQGDWHAVQPVEDFDLIQGDPLRARAILNTNHLGAHTDYFKGAGIQGRGCGKARLDEDFFSRLNTSLLYVNDTINSCFETKNSKIIIYYRHKKNYKRDM